jgi:hypothetical protein
LVKQIQIIMKKKFIPIALLILIACPYLTGQVTEAEKTIRTLPKDTIPLGWNTGGVIAINLAQTSLTNWVAGGQNSLAVNGLFSAFANLKTEKARWDNSLDIGYGLLKQGKDADARKTDDKIDFLSKYGQQAFSNFYYAALLNFKTQMAPGYNYVEPDTRDKISDIFSPAYLLIALGLDYKPTPYFSAFIAPLTAKFTIVTDQELSDAGAFGVTPGETVKSEVGGYLRAIYTRNDFQAEILRNVTFISKIDLFSNYAENPQNIDVSWENLIALKVNRFISVNINTHLLYDDDILVPWDVDSDGTISAGEGVRSKIQFKEILGVGFSYTF